MRCSRRQTAGLTLIEVIASLALLGTLLTGLVMAKSRLTRQSVSAEQRIEAVAAADRLLTQWVLLEEGVPCPDAGRIGEWRWATQWLEDDGLEEVSHGRVRLELWDATSASLSEGEPIPPACVVDVVVAKPADLAGGLP